MVVLERGAEKRVRHAIECARGAMTKPELVDVYLRRFHRAMDALETHAEREAVFDRCRKEGWYKLAAAAVAKEKT